MDMVCGSQCLADLVEGIPMATLLIIMLLLYVLSISNQWEKLFQKKHEVLSISELHCCRRLIELCRGTITAAYYYYKRKDK